MMKFWLNLLCAVVGFMAGIAVFCAYEHWMVGLFFSFVAIFAACSIFLSCVEEERRHE